MPFLGTTPTQGFVSSFPKQSFTPNGSTTVFTLTNPVASANDLEVFVGNVRQEPTTAYTAAGTTLTMSEAPDIGLNFYVINKSFAQVTTTPPVNSISTDKIINSAVTDAKIGGLAATKLTGTVASARFPAGTILQVLQQEFSSDIALTNNLTTFSNAGSLSITPRATSSKIFVFCTCSGDVQTGNHRAIYWDVIRSIDGGTAATIERTQYHMYDSNQQQHNININPLQFLDSPNTTGNCNYTLRGRHQSGSSESGTYNGYINRYNESHMTLMEVAG